MPVNKAYPISLAVCWPTFGPYHVARLNSLYRKLKNVGIRVIGIEITNRQCSYAWQKQHLPDEFARFTIFPNVLYEQQLRNPLGILKGILRALSTLNPTIVAVNGYSSWDAWSAILWGSIYKRRLILMSDSKEDDFERTKTKEFLKRVILTRFNSALCAGSPHQDYLRSLGLMQEQIYLGYDVVDNDYFKEKADNFRNHPERAAKLPGLHFYALPFFLSSARFLVRKNILGLLEAYEHYRMSLLANHQIPWRLVILGDGSERQTIEGYLENHNLSDHVTLAGIRQIDETPAYYGFARVFIHPALQDQWGLVVNEAMATGLPVFVSKRSGCADDIVRDGVNGFTFNPGDNSELVDLMLKATKGDVDLDEMGTNSQRIIASWGLDRFAQGMHSAVEKALQD